MKSKKEEKRRLARGLSIWSFAMSVALASMAAGYVLKIKPNEAIKGGDTITIEYDATLPTQPIPTPEEPALIPAPVPATSTNNLGVNLAGCDDWNAIAANLFNDAGLSARFIEGNPATGPSKWLTMTVTNGARPIRIAGVWTLIAKTTGTPTCTNGVVKSVAANTWEITITDNARDVRIDFPAKLDSYPQLWRPGADRMKLTSDAFRNYIRRGGFKFIRFMDMMVTNWADANDAAARWATLGADREMSWAERPSAEGPYHRLWGVSLEAAIQICNECGVDMWFNFPYTVNEDYMRGAALLLKAKLNAGLFVYCADVNETWNYAGGFYHSGLYAKDAAAWIAAGKTPKLDNPVDNEWYHAQRYCLMRLKTFSDLLRAQLGQDRVRPIFESQFGSGYFGNTLMWSKRTYGNNDWLYGIACAPYIWAQDGTPTDIINTLTKDYKTREAAGSKLAIMRAIADAHLKHNNVFFYEIGVDMNQGDQNLANRIAAAYDSRMVDLVREFLRTNTEWGGVKGAAYFNGVSTRTKWGPAWGLTDDAQDLTQPMFVGASQFASMPVPPNGSGVTASYYKTTDWTGTPLETKTVPLINHTWIAWTNGPLHAGQNPTWTEGKNGSIWFKGKYIVAAGAKSLVAECEANDKATLSVNGTFTEGAQVPFELKYVGIFDGTNCMVRLLSVDAAGVRTLVPQSRLLPN